MSSPDPPEQPSQDRNPAQKIGPKNVAGKLVTGKNVPVKNVSVPLPARPADALRAHPDDASFETDFADLAARFAAKSGGGLSAELSADLALEIVLNEIVEQACLATGATGAAIVLRRDSDMVCRATSGATSPDLGSRLDMSGGISGECVKTLRTVRCDDTLTDPRADAEASRRLGVRSVMVMPLLRGSELAGAFEVFSSRVCAFGDRDERTLEALAARTVKNLARAAQALIPAKAPASREASVSLRDDSLHPDCKTPDSKTIDATKAGTSSVPSSKSFTAEIPSKTVAEPKVLDQESAIRNLVLAANREAVMEESKNDESKRDENFGALTGGGPPDGTWWKRDFTTLALTAAVLVCTLMLGVVVAKHFQLRQKAVRVHSAPKVAAAKAAELTPAQSANDAAGSAEPQEPHSQPSNGITIRPVGRGDASSVPPGGLRIYDNGKEIFRETPAPIPADATPDTSTVVQRAAAIEPEQVVQLAPEAAEESLVQRVEPQYPDQARAQKIQGAVVLDVHIRANGAVERVHVISGDPLLARASSDAVKQWRYKPRTQNGQPTQMETRVTLNFRLPQ